ncbi:succinate dehydrogenase subunit 7, mitochondrial [Phalaenopsis equestris]|uniref:succinate dehydrogenase subunit 7, mitochondrial n=1 Tax=Phalaenopsis equestris TaxID=78828 RepID=UPI0009E3A9AD|nr:succinate dehydrogenase subunit 7, mitochondrial [Phalaenopsis equestris]
MAFPRSNSTIISSFRSRFQKEETHNIPRRGYHIELGAREKALLEEDPALKRFKSYKKSVKQASKIGNVLTILAVAACSYEIVAVAVSK